MRGLSCRCTVLGSKNIENSLRLAESALAAGDLARASQTTQVLLRGQPNHPEVLRLSAQVALAGRNADRAKQFVVKAIEANPRSPRFRVLHAQVLASLSDRQSAIAELKKAVDLAPDNVRNLSVCGRHFSLLEQHHDALGLFEKVAELQPDAAMAWYDLSATHRFLGNIEDAERCASTAIELDDNNMETHFVRSDLRRVTHNSNHIAEMERRREQGVDSLPDAAFLFYALAKEYDDIGEYESSIRRLREGSALKRKTFDYDVARDETIMAQIAECYTKPYLGEPAEGHDQEGPVFVVGMPRTGTTLLERILSGHSRIQSIGERPEFSIALTHETNKAAGSETVRDAGLVKASLQADFKALGEQYMRMTRTLRDGSEHFIDKLPINFLYLGLINRALPKAKIIHVVRDPMDTCFAVYRMVFNRTYPFSYDLEELARYYIGYRKLMTHWADVLANDIYTIGYEDLVEDTEAEARRLFEHLGVDFEPEALDIRSNMAASTTASASQVRRGIYKSSVKKWRNYEPWLDELHKRLGAADVLT